MEILQKGEAFKRIDGNMKFSYVQVFAQQDGMLYSGKCVNRLDMPKTLDDLQELKQISTEDRGPEVNTTWLAVYVKTPSLLAYANGNPEKQISREVETCEILRKNPHLNTAIYYGYMETHAAIKHLHSLGIVHNDINPANILLDEDGTLILNDFDRCRYIEESLHNTATKRTHHWHDSSVDISLAKNDLDAFKELTIWLNGSATEEFLFE
ncbi:hypothetical protein PENSUB_12490 [Penicillium subrubescens]|uniref:Protein kinase domain-containing protein n=1 Tax=Penicillium subrubescens TaxID=1316194 RepID=A0A1Q5SZI7_9EURO|nr:hypothetical protein PENSUB_12490 [Penicillium subrubescens]